MSIISFGEEFVGFVFCISVKIDKILKNCIMNDLYLSVLFRFLNENVISRQAHIGGCQ